MDSSHWFQSTTVLILFKTCCCFFCRFVFRIYVNVVLNILFMICRSLRHSHFYGLILVDTKTSFWSCLRTLRTLFRHRWDYFCLANVKIAHLWLPDELNHKTSRAQSFLHRVNKNKKHKIQPGVYWIFQKDCFPLRRGFLVFVNYLAKMFVNYQLYTPTGMKVAFHLKIIRGLSSTKLHKMLILLSFAWEFLALKVK